MLQYITFWGGRGLFVDIYSDSYHPKIHHVWVPWRLALGGDYRASGQGSGFFIGKRTRGTNTGGIRVCKKRERWT